MPIVFAYPRIRAPLLSRHRAQGLDEGFQLFIRHVVPGRLAFLNVSLTYKKGRVQMHFWEVTLKGTRVHEKSYIYTYIYTSRIGLQDFTSVPEPTDL